MRRLVFGVVAAVSCAGPPGPPGPPGPQGPQGRPGLVVTAPDASVVDSSTPRSVPGLSGFWCVEFRDEPDQPEYLAECYRTEDTCRKQREGASKSGMIVTECELSDRAHCFDVTQPQQHKIYWRCYETSYHCAVERAKYRKANPQPDLFFSECVLTAGHGGATPNEVRARVAGNRRLSSVRANRER